MATPFATRQLADMGARVIKIERPGVGDMRMTCWPSPPRSTNMSAVSS